MPYIENNNFTKRRKMYPFIFALFLGALWWFIHIWSIRKDGKKLPPGPRGLPIIGNLHMVGSLPHRSLHKLAKKYGPIMSLRLGSVPTIVVSSPEGAELILKTHDDVFASRPKLEIAKYLSYGAKGMVFTEYGPYWRSVRKFCTLELLTTKKIDSMAGMRREELNIMVKLLKEAAKTREVVDVSQMVAGLMENTTRRMLFGRSKDERFNLNPILHEIMYLAGAFNVADFVPFLAPFDIQGLTRRLKAIRKVVDRILEILIDEHEQEANNDYLMHDKDLIDIMLSMKNKTSHTNDELPFTIDRTCIKAILIDMIAGSIDTSSSIIEWVISNLIKHPRVMKKLQEELETTIGVNQVIKENDLPKLEYLHMVVKESFRLHPVGPLMVPHESMDDTLIQGYHIPKKSRVLVNVWALGRDSNIWSQNAEEFYPERFNGSKIDVKGHDFQLLPFGSGRRGCPGMQLGITNVHLVVAELAHCFDWELPDGMSPHTLDMSEYFGLSLSRANHLLAVPISRGKVLE